MHLDMVHSTIAPSPTLPSRCRSRPRQPSSFGIPFGRRPKLKLNAFSFRIAPHSATLQSHRATSTNNAGL